MPVVPIAAYAPYLIEVFAGPHAGGGGMVKIKSVCLPLTKEPTTVLSASEVFGFDPRAVKFRVVSTRGGGNDCCIGGIRLFVTGVNARWLETGDRVRRAATYTGDDGGVALGGPGDSRECIVLQATVPSSGSAEQRGILVAPVGPDGALGPATACRGSWLELVPPLPSVFAVGDRVSLDPGSWRRGDPTTGHKCLGEPHWGRFGVVVATGPVRDGMQRNVDVLAVTGSGGPGNSVLISELPSRSLYPSAALVAVVPAAVQAEHDGARGTAALEAAVRAAAKGVPEESVKSLVQMARALGPAVWSHAVPICGASSSATACAEWFARPAAAVVTSCNGDDVAADVAELAAREEAVAAAEEASVAATLAAATAAAAASRASVAAAAAAAAASSSMAHAAEVPSVTVGIVEAPSAADATSATADAPTVAGEVPSIAERTAPSTETTAAGEVSATEAQAEGDVSAQAEGEVSATEAQAEPLAAPLKVAEAMLEPVPVGPTPVVQPAPAAAAPEPARRRFRFSLGLRDASARAAAATLLTLADLPAAAEALQAQQVIIDRTFGAALPADDGGAIERGVNVRLAAWRRNEVLGPALPMLEPLGSWEDWTERRDAGNSLALHHAAALGLRSTYAVLVTARYSNGIAGAEWATNAAGETPAALLEGIPVAAALLHRALRERSVVSAVMAKALCCSIAGGDVAAVRALLPSEAAEALAECATALQSGEPEDALAALESLAADVGSDAARCARVYTALALLDAGFGAPAAAAELDAYAAETDVGCAAAAAAGAAPPHVDPLYLYALWAAGGEAARSRRSARLVAADALRAARLFPAVASSWIEEGDDLDVRVAAEAPLPAHADEPDSHEDDVVEAEPAAAAGTPEFEWGVAKQDLLVRSPAMDELMALTGLAAVKGTAMTMLKEVLLAKTRPADVKSNVCMNMLFVGNPGTGKTTVAHLFGRVMSEVGFRKNAKPVITDANAILGSVDPVGCIGGLILQAAGGILVIDEAYQFSPAPAGSTANASNHVLDALLRAAEALRNSTSFVLAGYEAPIDKLLRYNAGMPSRFPFKFVFPDYTERQLKGIFLGMVKADGYALQGRAECATPVAAVFAARLARGAGREGFGNARAVRSALDAVKSAHKDRLGTAVLHGRAVTPRDHRLLLREDVLGPRPALEGSPLLGELDALVGLPRVKAAVRGLLDLQLQNYEREEAGERPLLVSLHRVFTGNPGTGKTSVARIYGALLREFRLLSDGGVSTVSASDLMGSAVGQAAEKTAEALRGALGRVLLIDEACVLDPKRRAEGGMASANVYAGAVIDTLVEKLDGEAGSDCAVILAGYDGAMKSLFRNCGNDGLRRRFNLSEALAFDDFSDAELKAVLKRAVVRDGLVIDPKTAAAVVGYVARERKLDGFGNAGAIGSALNVAKKAQATRLRAEAAARKAAAAASDGDGATTPAAAPPPSPNLLELSDFDAAGATGGAAAARGALSGLLHLDFLDADLSELDATLVAAKAEGRAVDDILGSAHMVFTGPPGTGKTTIAKRFGRVFRDLELLPTANVVVVTAKNLLGEFVGSTPPKVAERMRAALGGILFIDEAYALVDDRGSGGGRSTYGDEAIQALVDNITLDEFAGKLVVIFAGYEAQMNELFARANPGFASRFNRRRVAFPAWTAQQAVEAALTETGESGIGLTPAAADELAAGFGELVLAPQWASARDVKQVILPSMYSKRALRLHRARQSAAAEGPAPAAPAASPRRRTGAAAAPPPPYEAEDVAAAFEAELKTRRQLVGADRRAAAAAAAAAATADAAFVALASALERPRSASTLKYADVNTEAGGGSDGAGGGGGGVDGDIAALLLEVSLELGYSEGDIEAFCGSGDVPEDVVKEVMARTGARDIAAARASCRGQAPRTRALMVLAIAQRAATKTAAQAAVQRKLQRIGKCCMGFDWIKTDGGYRCAGGSHYCTDADLDAE